MSTETGPIYSVPLIDALPIPGSNMKQAMPGRSELERVTSIRTAAAYEVLLCHWHNQNERIKELTEACKLAAASIETATEMGFTSHGLVAAHGNILAVITKAKEPT